MRHTTSIYVGLPLPTPTTHRKRKNPRITKPAQNVKPITPAAQSDRRSRADLAPHLATARQMIETPNAAAPTNILKYKA